MKQKVVVLIGPTAVGKTATSIALAKAINAEIINGDALQVYKGLTIGTAKISEEEMEGIPHHLLSIREPDEAFSVADYQSIVRKKIQEIAARGKVPLIVGGTGMYIQSILYDFRFNSSPQDMELREELESEAAIALWNKLDTLDPEAATTISYQNKQRVIRALERVMSAGITQKEQQQDTGNEPYYDFYIIGLNRDRQELYDRINYRVEVMIKQGLLEEVKQLLSYVPKEAQSFKAIGYKEVIEAIDGNWPRQLLVETIQQNTRRYAKRQLTYFRNKLPVNWYHPEKDITQIEQDCQKFLKENNEELANK